MARRVNTRFLIILTAIVVGGGAIAFAVKILSRGDPAKFVEQGKQMMADKRWEEAAPLLARAASLSPRDPQIHILYGEVAEQLAAQESDPGEMITRSRVEYQRAVELDLQNLPALHKLLDSYTAELKLTVHPETLQSLSDTAKKILAIKPDDSDAMTALPGATIRGWMAGVATDDQAIEPAIKDLKAAVAKNPANADAVALISAAYLRRAQLALRATGTNQERIAASRKELDAAIAVVEPALKGQETNPKMAFTAAQTYLNIAGMDMDEALAKKHHERAREILTAIQKTTPETDPNYVDIRVMWGGLLQQEKDKAGAEKVYTEVMKKAPYAPGPRLALSQLLSSEPDRRDDAIALLDKPLAKNPNGTGFDVLVAKEYDKRALMEATSLRVDSYGASKDAKEKAALKDQIDGGIARLTDNFGVSPAVLKIKGKFQLMAGDNVAAIQTLSKALNIQTQSSADKDYDLIYQLGRAYITTKQTGQAKTMLTQVVEKAPNFVPARILLAQLYLDDKQGTEANQQLDALEKLQPDSPDVLRMRFRAYQVDGKTDRAAELYAKLPETTKMDRLFKAQAAISQNQTAEAIKVLERANKDLPEDLDVTVNLVQLYILDKQEAKAEKVLEAGIAANPTNQTLQMLKSRLNSSTPVDAVKNAEEEINKISDPFMREIRLAELYRSQQKYDESAKHLMLAEKAKPGDPRVADALFQVNLALKKFDEAAKYIPALSKANQDQADGDIYRYRLAFAQGKFAESEALGLELTTKLPEFAQSWVCYGQALEANGKYPDAVDKYTRALERQNNNVEAYKGLIDCSLRLGKTDEAARYIDQARKAFPNDRSFREVQLNYQLAYEDPAQVIAPRKEDLAANPDDIGSWKALAVAYLKSAQYNATRANAAAQTNEYIKQARDLLANAVKKFPSDRILVGMYADSCAALEDFAPAEAALSAFGARDEWKGKPDPKLMQAELYARMGRWDDAENAYTAALKLSDNSVEIRLLASAFLASRGKIEPALALVPADDDDARIRRQRINILSSAGRFPEAEQAVRASLVKTPDSLEMQALLASVYLDQGQFENASAQLETVLAKDPNNRMAQYIRGLVKMRKSPPDLDGAIADLLAASDATPNNADVRIALADAYTARNSVDQAARVLSAGVKLAPTNKQLRLKLLALDVRNERWSDVDSLLREASLLAPLQQDPEWLAAEASAWGARGSFDKAADRMKAAMALAPDNLNLTQQYINLLIQGRNYKAAIVAADKVVQANDAWWAHQAKAIAKNAMNDRSGAEADLTSALKSADAAKNDNAISSVINTWTDQFGPDEALAQLKSRLDSGIRWRLLATSIYLKKQDYAAAKASMDATMADLDKASPADQLNALRFAGSFYLNVFPAEPNKSRDAYLKVLDRTPNDIAALNNMACLLAEGVTPKEPVQALKYSSVAYDSLQRTGEFNARIYDTQGWMLILNGKVQDGIDILEQVVARSPFTDAHYHLAMGYLKLQNPRAEEAQRQLAMATEAYNAAAKTQQVDPAMKARIEKASAQVAEILKNFSPKTPTTNSN